MRRKILSFTRWKRNLALALMVAGEMCVARCAFATNGTMLTGNSVKSDGIGGASVAFPQDSTAAADNPAGMAYVGNQFDIYGALITTDINATFGSPANQFFTRRDVPIGGGGFNYHIDARWTFGVSVYGAGLLANSHAPVAPGLGPADTSFIQINAAPTVTYKVLPNLSVGASVILGVEQFRANGLFSVGSTGALVAAPSHGTSYAAGIGGAAGVLWNPVPILDVGASYYTPMSFSKLAGYKDDIFASTGGSINGPAHYGVGLALHPLSALTLAVDYLRIQWGSTAPFNDFSTFNWHNQNVVRFGVAYDVNSKLTIRTGYSMANSYVDSDHTAANFYTSGIADRAITLGATYSINRSNEISAAFEYDIPRTLVGTGTSTGTNIHLNFQVFMLGYTHTF